MGVMNVYAMDIEDFITAKAKDTKKLDHFNISVMVDDDFLAAVQKDENIFLHFPVYRSDGKIETDPSKWVYSKEISAKYLWDLITNNAYMTGEPGVLFYDTMNRDNNLWYAESIVATNPCFTGDMKLLTASGYKTFRELDGQEFAIINLAGNATWSKVWCTGKKHVITLVLDNSERITCTPDHKFMSTLDGGWGKEDVEAKDLLGRYLITHDKVVFDAPSKYAKVVQIIDTGETATVYDFTEPRYHYGFVNGVVAHNCGEYLAGTVFNGELPPEQYGGACNLGSLFLHRFVVNPFEENAYLDFERLDAVIRIAVRMLDNVIDVNHFPDPIYENYQKLFRTIGLGTTGLADMLVMLNMRYDAPNTRVFVDELYNYISMCAYRASCELAKERGAFPGYDRDQFLKSNYLKKQKGKDWKEVVEDIGKYGMRNAKMLSVAPCGTLSLTFGNNCSSGIEPIFSLEYSRKVKFGGQSDDDAKIVRMMDDAYREWSDKENKIVGADKFVTAMNISVNDHVDMLGVIAKHIDMSVSKTINIPTDYSFEDTQEVYMKAHDLGIKGCTIFRPNPVRQGILITDKPEEPQEKLPANTTELPRGFILNTTNDCIGRKRKLITGCGSLHCTAWFDPVTGDLLEVFLDKGSSGGCERNLQAISRMISISARAGVDIHAIVKQLQSVGGCTAYCVRNATKHDTSKGSSCSSAVGYALLDMWQDVQNELISDDFAEDEQSIDPAEKTPEIELSESLSNTVSACPKCGEPLVFEGGCVVCKSCGYSKCE